MSERNFSPRTAVGAALGLLAAASAAPAFADVNSDWQTRISSPGVFYYNNFDFASTAELQASSYLPPNGGVTIPSDVTLETTTKLSGRGACRIAIRPDEDENITSYRHSFVMPVGSQTKSLIKKTFYYQFAIYLPAYMLDHRFATLNNQSTVSNKYVIIEQPDSSFDPGEVVVTNREFRRFVTAYRFNNNAVVPFDQAISNVPGTNANPDYRWQNAIDAGPQSSGGQTDQTSNALAKQRYGPLWGSFTATNNYGTSLSAQGNPEASAAINGETWQPNAWNVVEVLIDYPNQTVKMWHAVYGQQPKLVLNFAGNADLGQNTATYSGAQLVPRLEQMIADPARLPTYAIYSEVIAGDQFIPFPGNTVRPNPPTGVTAQ